MIEINVETLVQCIIYGGVFLMALTYGLIILVALLVITKNR